MTNPAFASVATMAISGTDVYFAGYDGPSSVYWKNGVEHVLPTAASPIPRATVSGMAISGTDIYFAGFDYQSAVYWKNGVEIKLPSLSNSSTGSSAVGIAIAGNDIYLAGTENSQGKDTTVAGQTFVPTITAPVYWKNSKPFALPLANGGNGTVTTMAVVSY